MDTHIRLLRREELLIDHGGWFDEENAERVVSWLVAAEDRSPVVLVGAGFSLNARDRETGRPATCQQAPLWSDVVHRLAADLGVKSDHYDAPTLCELYQEEFGVAKLRDVLRALTTDIALEPGRAHEALAAYPCEAIVTTNCLDTLLDKACAIGWRRVVMDTELSVPGQLRDLIYLHGHRDAPESWIMTRSQYEDFHRSKPVMVARVRQLLAQHPWLVVGFGMSDPNFHALTRLLGTEMRGHQPLSLVLMRNSPPAAERQHWRRLGFVMAAPQRDQGDLGEFFARVLPKLATRYSPTSEAAKAFIRRAPTPVERLQRFRLVNPVPIVDRDAAYRAWEDQLKGLLTEEERTAARDAAQAAARALFESRLRVPQDRGESERLYVGSPPAPPLHSAILNALEHVSEFRPLARDDTVQCLDRLLTRDGIVRAELTRHFAWALQHHLFDSSHPRPLMEIVTINLAKEVGWSNKRIEGLIETAFTLVRKYEHESTEILLAHHVTRLGFAPPAPDVEPKDSHLIEAKAGYRAFMNADFGLAAKHYGNAGKIAAATGLDFEAWAYTTGHADALEAESEATSDSDIESDSDYGENALREQAARLALRPVVEHWLDRADARVRKALREGFESERTRERVRLTGSNESRSSNSVNELWRSYRDLHTIHAPPSLQRRYLAPLSPFMDADDVRSVISYVARPQEWFDVLLRRAPQTVADREERDRELVDGILNADEGSVTKTERLAAVKCIRRLSSVLRATDVSPALLWLKETAASYPEQSQVTAWRSRFVGDDYWAAFASSAQWAQPAEALDVARTIFGQGGNRSTRGAAQAFDELPWHAWQLAENTETARGFLASLTQLLPDEWTDPVRHHTEVASALFALLRMVHAGLAIETLRPHVARWKQELDHVKSQPASATRYSDAKRAGYLLERELQRKALVSAQRPVELFEGWFGTADKGDEDLDHREELWLALAETVDAAASPTDPLVQRLVAEVRGLVNDEEAAKRYELNPHHASPAILLLAKGLLLLPTDRRIIAPSLLRLIQGAPQQVTAIAPVLAQEFWADEDWDRLRDLLVAMCGGGPASFASRRREDPGLVTRCQRAVLSLFGKLDRDRFQRGEEALWYTLQGFALASVTDERFAVASTAAFSVVAVAKDVDMPTEAKLYSAAIRRIAADARAEVRSAIAHKGLGLVSAARSELVREAAREAIAEVRSDQNAQVCSLLARAQAREHERRATEVASMPPAPPKATGSTSAPSTEELS